MKSVIMVLSSIFQTLLRGKIKPHDMMVSRSTAVDLIRGKDQVKNFIEFFTDPKYYFLALFVFSGTYFLSASTFSCCTSVLCTNPSITLIIVLS